MIIRIMTNTGTVNLTPQVVRVVRVYNHDIPSGIPETEFAAKGDLLVGTGSGTYSNRTVGSDGQVLTADSGEADGVKWAVPSISITDATNFLINGGFDFARRTTPGTLTTVSDNAYGADRWKMTRENADLQYQRNDATAESGLTSKYYGKFKKITNAGKFMVLQILEGVNTVPLRGKTIIFQAKMKASSAKTIRMAILQLATAGTMDTIPNPIVTAWNVDSTDPTLGTNVAVVTGVESKSVTTAWTQFSVSVTAPGDCKNLICAVWSDADFSAADELNIAEAGLFLGASTLAWTPRLTQQELALCMRYYYKTFSVDTLPAQNAGQTGAWRFPAVTAGATVQRPSAFRLPVTMRVAPTTVTFYNPSAANAQARDVIAAADCTSTASSAAILSPDTIGVTCTAAAGTAAGYAIDVHMTAEAEL